MQQRAKAKQTSKVPTASLSSVEQRIRSAYKHLDIRDRQTETDPEQSDRDETRILASPILLKDKLRRAVNYVADRALASLVDAEVRGQASMLDRKNAALTVAICADKLLLLAGEPTARFAGEIAPTPDVLAALAQRLGRAASLVLEARAERLALPGHELVANDELGANDASSASVALDGANLADVGAPASSSGAS